MPVPQPPSGIWGLTVDSPVAQDASYALTSVDRNYLDSQARGAQTHLVQSLLTGLHCTWLTLDPGSAQVVAGSAVCSAGTYARTVTLATATPLAAAGCAAGVVVVPAPPGGKVLVALDGVLPASISGLAGGGNIFVKVITGTGGLVAVGSLSSSDYPIGTVDAVGNVTLLRSFSPGSGGGGSQLVAVTVNSAGSVTLTNGQIAFVDASGGTCAITPPALAPNAVFGVCDGKKGGSFNAGQGANVVNSGSNLEDSNAATGAMAANPLPLRQQGQTVIWQGDPTGTFWKVVGG